MECTCNTVACVILFVIFLKNYACVILNLQCRCGVSTPEWLVSHRSPEFISGVFSGIHCTNSEIKLFGFGSPVHYLPAL